MSKSIKIFALAAGLAFAGAAVAVTSPASGVATCTVVKDSTLEAAITKAMAEGNLDAVIGAQVAAGVCVDSLAAAMVNAGVAPSAAIAALKAAGAADAKIASSLKAAVPSSDAAASTDLDVALADSDINPTAAGPADPASPAGGGPATAPSTNPFTSSSGTGGGGGSTASAS